MIDNNSVIIRKTASELVDAYVKALQMVEASYTQLAEAGKILEDAFGHEAYMYTVPKSSDPMRECEEIAKELKKRAWRRILNISEINKMLSIKRAEEMDRRIESGELPEITLDEVFSMLHSVADNAGEFVREAAAEVFDVLRPASHGTYGSQYKTNLKNGKYNLGEKVILSGYVERWSFGGSWRISYYREKNLIAVDRVFHALDGNLKGMDSSYRGPLCDAIGTSETGAGETEYFSFVCYQNHNLHLKFKRMDLVTRLNAINGDPGALTA